MKNHFLKYIGVCWAICLTASACAQFPAPDPYPYRSPATVVNEALQWSARFENYIQLWSQGLAPAAIPDSLIPEGISDSKNFYLKTPALTTAAETWATRFAKPINKDSLYGGIPDPNVTYLFLGTALAPFGSKLVVEGEFPHCRFFSFQITAPLSGEEYYAQRQFGAAEVAIADVDIEPLPGHVNPFRVGANRNAANRSYRLEFELTTGDPLVLNPQAHQYPYRHPSNTRAGSMLVYQGPLGHKTVVGTPLPDPGDWNLGALWVRIYRPDDAKGPLGGVPMPRVYFELPDGTRYFIGSDFSTLQQRADFSMPNRVSPARQNSNFGPALGWGKSYSISRSLFNGIAQANNWTHLRPNIRALDLGWTGRGEDQPAPRNMEPHATTNNYVSYVGRSMVIPAGYVGVLTGKMPTFPATRGGNPVMEAGMVRYWSIIGIDQEPFSQNPASTVHAIMDEEVILDSARNYVIAYSSAADRPANAHAAQGVSWVDWGTQNYLGLLTRWTCIAPDWYFPQAPHENHIPYSLGDWSSATYDSTLLGLNWRNGWMSCLLPKVHLMKKEVFEALGNTVNAETVPAWVDSTYRPGAAESRLGTPAASGVLNTQPENRILHLTDGDLNTGWGGPWNTQSAWVEVDLGTPKIISAVKLFWDWVLFAKDYDVLVSNDRTNWTVIASADQENGQIDLYSGLQGVKGRYVRLDLKAFNLFYYRLMEFEVYTSDCACDLVATSNSGIRKVQEGLVFAPNPSREAVQISAPWAAADRMEVFDPLGRRIRAQSSPEFPLRLATGNWPPGLYQVVVTHRGERVRGALLVLGGD